MIIDMKSRARCANCGQIIAKPHRDDVTRYCSHSCAVAKQPQYVLTTIRNTGGAQA